MYLPWKHIRFSNLTGLFETRQCLQIFGPHNIFALVDHILDMARFDPAPSDEALAQEREVWQETTNTRERLRAVVMGLQEPASATTIAERAQCSVNAARTHLAEFADIGIVRKHDRSAGTQYVRNESYVHWRRANELATSHTIEELLEELATFEARDEQYRERFDAATPSDVDLPEATHAELEVQLETLSEWATVRESIDRHKEAIRIARRSDSRLTA